MIIPRKIANLIEKKLFGEPSVIILYGPRQAGKTTLITELLNKLNKENIAAFNGDDLRTRDLFGTPSLDLLKNAVGDKKYLFIGFCKVINFPVLRVCFSLYWICFGIYWIGQRIFNVFFSHKTKICVD